MAYRILTAAALAVALAAPALAADGPPLVLQPGSGAAIQLPAPVKNVFVTNPEVAGAEIQSIEPGGKTLVYIFAKNPGKTAVFALGEGGSVALDYTVDVPGPRTVRVLHGNHRAEIWSEVHGKEPTLADLPPGSSVTIPAGAAK